MSFWEEELKDEKEKIKREVQIEMIMNMKREGISSTNIHNIVKKYSVEEIENM